MSPKRPSGLYLVLALTLAQAWADAPAPSSDVAAFGVVLPRTDGIGLAPRPAPLGPEVRRRFFDAGQRACDGPCVTPFGTVLGVADGAQGRSNCVSTCIRLEYSFLDLQTGEISVHREPPGSPTARYVGVTYQCVEYARKWWMKNLGLTFGDVDGAHDILYLTEGKQLEFAHAVPLARSLNGTARRPPKRGDLLVYYPEPSVPEWRHGHVAVVVGVELDAGLVALAEENYDNQPWVEPQRYARRIRLFEVGGRYTLVDVPAGSHRSPTGGRIAGWIYPADDAR